MKTVLITGGNRGIGWALAEFLGKQGCRVLLTSRRRITGEEAVRNLNNRGIDAHFFKLDVLSEVDIEHAVSAISAQFGSIDILINNAGMMHAEESWIGNSTLTVSEKALTQTFLTNFIGPWKVSKAFLPLLEKSNNAQVINISAKIASMTLGSDKRFPNYNSKPFAYNASKGALNELTVHLAHATRRQKIRVLSVYPGWVQTDMGGSNASLTAEQAARHLYSILNNSEYSSGSFVDFEHVLPW